MLFKFTLSVAAMCAVLVSATPLERRDAASIVRWPHFCDVTNSSAVCKLPAIPEGGIDGFLGKLDKKVCTKFGGTILCKKDICPWASPISECLPKEIFEPVEITWPPECLVCDRDKIDLRIPKDFISIPKDLVSTSSQLKNRSPEPAALEPNETDEIIIIIIW